MALTESLDVPLGTPMPSFSLKDSEGNLHQSDDLFGPKGLLVVFTCNHCPYAKALWPRQNRLALEAAELKIQTVAINPNIHPEYPEDGPEVMRQKIKEWKVQYPYLVDENQEVAKAFKAQCTPDLYLFDANKKLVYHGRFDDNWKDENQVKSAELPEAVRQLAAGKPIAEKQPPSMGCSIKWK